MPAPLGLLLAACAALAGCSTSSGPSECNDAYDCRAGQTCGTSDGTSFSSVTAGPAGEGATRVGAR
jgi:hypothetical protein